MQRLSSKQLKVSRIKSCTSHLLSKDRCKNLWFLILPSSLTNKCMAVDKTSIQTRWKTQCFRIWIKTIPCSLMNLEKFKIMEISSNNSKTRHQWRRCGLVKIPTEMLNRRPCGRARLPIKTTNLQIKHSFNRQWSWMIQGCTINRMTSSLPSSNSLTIFRRDLPLILKMLYHMMNRLYLPWLRETSKEHLMMIVRYLILRVTYHWL